jgi:hypothetical protein
MTAASYRLCVATDTKFATNAVDHCPVLPAGCYEPYFGASDAEGVGIAVGRYVYALLKTGD